LIAHHRKLSEMEVGGDVCKAKRNWKMFNKLLFTGEIFLAFFTALFA
jgi:hypothetical protein